MPIVYIFVLAVLTCALASPASADPKAAQIRKLAHGVIDAIDRADANRIEAHLSPTFISIRGQGQVTDRKAFLSDVRATPVVSGDGRIRHWNDLQVIVAEDAATYVGRTMWREVGEGSAARSVFSTLIVQQWRATQAGWLLESMQRTRLPPMPEVRPFRSGDLTLQAMLFRPSGDGPNPAIVYAHGNEPDPTDLFEAVAPPLVARGYVVWAPHRRGSGLSADQGPNLLRTLTEIEAKQGIAARSQHAIAELEGPHLSDMAAAIAEVKTFSFVDPSRVYLIGNSFGGVLAMLAAERDIGARAVANFAGSAINWERSQVFQNRMTNAARNARVPVFLGQAANDFSTAPTLILGQVMKSANKAHKAIIYPRFGITPLEGHTFGVDGIEIWAADVLPFLESAK